MVMFCKLTESLVVVLHCVFRLDTLYVDAECVVADKAGRPHAHNVIVPPQVIRRRQILQPRDGVSILFTRKYRRPQPVCSELQNAS